MQNLKPIHVHIKNFQSIEDLSFDVHGFSCLVGKTNAGKSSLLRAMSGALLNKPVTNLVRKGTKSCMVRLSSEGWGLLWEKAEKGLNRYTIEGKAEVLENVGPKQPEQVSAFGFRSVRIGEKDLYPWYASQWSPVFLLDEGGPTVTQFISEISGLDVLQKAITLGLKEKKKSLDDAKLATAEVESVNVKINQIDELDDLISMTAELESQSQSIEQYEFRLEMIRKFLDEIDKALKLEKVLSPVSSVRLPSTSLQGDVDRLQSMHDALLGLEEAAKRVIALKGKTVEVPICPSEEFDTWSKIKKFSDVDGLKKCVDKLKNVSSVDVPTHDYEQELKSLNESRVRAKKIDELSKSIAILDKTIQLSEIDESSQLSDIEKRKKMCVEIEKLRAEIQTFTGQLYDVDEQLTSVGTELASIPSCPTCSRPILSGQESHGVVCGLSPDDV